MYVPLSTWTTFPLLWIYPISIMLHPWNIYSSLFKFQDKTLFIEAIVNFFSNCDSVNNDIF